MNTKKILIIDDSPFTRKIIKEMIEESPEFEVIDTASNGLEGLKKVLKHKPDLITLDLEMPEMDGFTLLRFIMAQQPTPVIIVSSLSSSEDVFKALELGAIDFVTKPSSKATYQLLEIKRDLLFKIRAALMIKKEPEKLKEEPLKKPSMSIDKIIAIGASTGGPQAIQKILTYFKEPLDVPILIAQHMPEGFTKVFAERLNRISPFNVYEATEGMLIENKNVYISPGGYHMSVIKKEAKFYIKLVKKKDSDIYVPSVNHLFNSLVPYAERTIAIILTGMGSDGKEGAIKLKEAGAEIWAESQDTAIIFGMPKEVISAGIVDHIYPLNDIPIFLEKKLNL
ncbi:MAG: chemotaxis response regulator protein-glutamate methylesterase [Proteobacteria bacterium]|nr:chemotaxis response regulator protein-glutamate methylesterase [Pseudomonadota bacterium]